MDLHISKEEVEKIEKWRIEHECSLKQVPRILPPPIELTPETTVKDLVGCYGCIGGAVTYMLTPNSIGMTVKAKCACGSEVDATDYDCW